MAKKSASDVKMGGASVAIGADSSLFSKVIAGTEKRLQAFAAKAREIGSRASLWGVGIVAASAAVAKSFADATWAAGSVAPRLGLSTEDLVNARALKAAFVSLDKSIMHVRNAFGSALAPVLAQVINSMAAGAEKLAVFIKHNQGLVVAGVAAAAAIAGTGIALLSMSKAATLAALALKGVGIAMAFVSSPFGIVLGLVAAAIAAFVRFTDVGKAMAGDVVQAFQSILQTAKDTFKGVADALLAGNIELAGKIVWAGLKVIWLTGCDAITTIWRRAMLEMEGVFLSFGDSIRHVWQEISNTLAVPIAWAIAKAKGLDPAAVQKQLEGENRDQHNKIDKDMNRRRADLAQRKANFAANQSPELAQAQAELNALLAQAAKEADDAKKKHEQQAAKLGAVAGAARAPIAANLRDSQGAASTIARSFNQQLNNIPAQTLAAIKAQGQTLKERVWQKLLASLTYCGA